MIQLFVNRIIETANYILGWFKAHDARHVANWFINRAHAEGKTLTCIRIMKLCYIAHGWHLEMQNSPLIKNKFRAWRFGPIVPVLYEELSIQGLDTVQAIPMNSPKFTEKQKKILEDIWNVYNSMDSSRLTRIIKDTAWRYTIHRRGLYASIPNKLIRYHYIEKREKHDEKTKNTDNDLNNLLERLGVQASE